MDEVYASPAKRRKMFAEQDHMKDAMVSSSSKVAGSRLKGDVSTPSKLKQAVNASEPHTPGLKKHSISMEDGLLSVSPQQLAPNLMLLNQLLGALYVTLPLVKSRGKAATYQNLRVPVQNFCGRDFQVKHVQQIKALCSEALDWEHILAFNSSTKRQEQQLCLSMPTNPTNPKQAADTTHLQQLFFQRLQQHQASAGAKIAEVELPLAELPPPAAPKARDCTPSRQRISSSLLPSTPQTAPPAGNLNQLMTSPPPKRLATVARMPAESQQMMMSPPPPRARGSSRQHLRLGAGDAASADFTFSPAPCQPDLLSPRGATASNRGLFTPSKESTEAADVSETEPAGNTTPGLRPNKLFGTPLAAATPQQASAPRPNTHATPQAVGEDDARPAGRGAGAGCGVKVRKLTFDAAAPSGPAAARAAAAAPGTSEKAPVQASNTEDNGTREASKTRGGIKFELGATAMALLKQVSSAEVKQEQAVKRQQMDQHRTLDMLPGSFEVLRSIFGERGPCVKPKSEVVQLLRQKSTCRSGMSLTDAAEQLELMLRFVPEFVRAVTSPGMSLAGITQSVRINRQVTWPAARQKLLTAAAEARCAGAAAAAAVVAEQEHEAAEAAAAAATVDLEEGSVGSEDGGSGAESDGEDELAVVSEGLPDAAGPESGGIDQIGLSILSELTGYGDSSCSKQQPGRSGSSSSKGDAGAEALLLLGSGGTRRSGSRGAASSAVLGALAFKVPSSKAFLKI